MAGIKDFVILSLIIVAFGVLCGFELKSSCNDTAPMSININKSSMIEEVPVIRPEPLIFSMEVDGKVKEMSAEEYLDEIFVEVEEWTPPKSDKSYYGTMECTAYIATGKPCADGQWPELCWTVACNDPALWHKRIHIEGLGDYYVHDTGGMASNVLDIFVESYDAAINFGRQERRVFVYE